jgi:hypothetical protein
VAKVVGGDCNAQAINGEKIADVKRAAAGSAVVANEHVRA